MTFLEYLPFFEYLSFTEYLIFNNHALGHLALLTEHLPLLVYGTIFLILPFPLKSFSSSFPMPRPWLGPALLPNILKCYFYNEFDRLKVSLVALHGL